MTREGKPKPQVPGGECDTSIFADEYFILGLACYSVASGDRKAYEVAKKQYNLVIEKLRSGDYKADPYPLIQGYKCPPMDELYLSQEMAFVMEKFRDNEAAAADETATSSMLQTINTFTSPDFVRHEMIAMDGSFMRNTAVC